MVYFTKNDTSILVPKVFEADPTKITFEQQTTHQLFTFNVEDTAEPNHSHYVFEVDLSTMADGQYNYTMYNDDEVPVGNGIAQCGDFVPEVNTTYNNSRNYVEYNG